MAQPIIAITARQAPHEGKELFGCPASYVRALERAGGLPVLVFPQPGRAADLLARVDGVLLSGGADIAPQLYGQASHETVKATDPQRDAMELELARAARQAGVPMLGICRGCQMLNVAFGGTLLQDVPSLVPGARTHQTRELDVHDIRIEPGTMLEQILGLSSLRVNSRHHQAVDRVGAGLRVNCRSEDGVIEGVESSQGLPILAVQCHPEDCLDLRPPLLGLFRWLVQRATGRQQL